MPESFSNRVYKFLENFPHPYTTELSRALAAKTSVSTSGYPYISHSAFSLFLSEVPHLFIHGRDLLDWLARLEEGLKHTTIFRENELVSIRRCTSVLRNIVFSAGVCSPSDLWILKHVLSSHVGIGLVNLFLDGGFIERDEIAERFGLNRKHLLWDLSFLHSRGYLRCRGSRYALEQTYQAADTFHKAKHLPSEFLTDMVELISRVLSGTAKQEEQNIVQEFYGTYEVTEHTSKGWMADHSQIEIGYRLVPTVLALHLLKRVSRIEPELNIQETFPGCSNSILKLLNQAGMVQEDRITLLGARIFSRAPGPFGIIHAYIPYMRELENKLRGRSEHTHVQRAKNIVASQAANRKTFAMGNDSLDRFCQEQNFKYRVFIEHALGQGEATRQRLERSGETDLQYFGADLEDAAIDAAAALQRKGTLPRNMLFIRNADIANPEVVLDALRQSGYADEQGVMFVGNGFHEIRAQTNARIIEVFQKYCEARLLIIFTEESALGDHDLLSTGWNTYHAGFRYVHELSGQGLRPAAGVDVEGRYSWKICASLGGYAVLQKYSAHTRTIYPFPRKRGYNPPISMTYFCVPEKLARGLGFYPVNWTQTEAKGGGSLILEEEENS
jgi:hypothetical protein